MHAVLTVAGIAAALATVVFANLGMTLGTASRPDLPSH
jgi:hypothetical protein